MRVLVVNERKSAREEIAEPLRDRGYLVTESPSFADAKHLLGPADPAVDIAFFPSLAVGGDGRAPGNEGLGPEQKSFIERARAQQDSIFLFLLTDPGELTAVAPAVVQGIIDGYILTPVHPGDLRARTHAAARLLRSERAQKQTRNAPEDSPHGRMETLRRTQHEILGRIFNALESCGEETDAHIRRVGWICSRMAALLGWGQEKTEAIRVAAALHDIGKLAIPDAVLRKPGSLNKTEMALARQHAPIGSRILGGSADPVVRMAETIARHHHENWDGSGYPDGLEGGDIPIEARIAAIADVYDALMSERVYRMALPAEEAARVVARGSGTQFDPGLCNLFLNNITAICREFAEEEARYGERPAEFTE